MLYAQLVKFSVIKVHIPNKMIRKDLDKIHLNIRRVARYRKLKHKIEQSLYQLEHANSVIDRILLKSSD